MKFCAVINARKITVLIALGLGTLSVTQAQVPNIYNQFFMNPYVYNPAYAGVEGHAAIFAMYKKQWSNIEGGPEFSHVTFHMPLKGGLAFGAAAYNETEGLLSTTSGKITGGYLVTLDRKHYLRFGLSIGAGTRSINTAELDEFSLTDPAFAGFNDSNLFLRGDFGVTYHFDHFNIGVSLPKLFADDIITEESLAPISVQPQDNLLLKANYRGHINHQIAIEPHVLYRYNAILPDQWEATAIVHLKHIVWIGAGYRQDAGIITTLGTKIKKQMAIGLAYEIGNPDYGTELGPSFEIHVGYHIAKHRGKSHPKRHDYSFIDSENDELVAKYQREQEALANYEATVATTSVTDPKTTQDRLNRLQSSTGLSWSYQTMTTVNRPNDLGVVQEIPKLTGSGESGATEIVYAFPPPNLDNGEDWRFLETEEKELIKRERPDGTREAGVKWYRSGEGDAYEQTIKYEPILLETETQKQVTTQVETEEDPTEQVSYESLINDPDSHLEVQRGDHLLELPAGNYVIGGVFNDFQSAEELSDEMFKEGFRNTLVGYLTARNNYYVVLDSFDSVESARNKREQVKNTSGLKDVWVLKVNE